MPNAIPTVIKRSLIVFVKSPIPGNVKTRLIPHLSSAEAADLYKCFVTDILQNVSQIGIAKVIVAYQPHAKAADLSWAGLRTLPELFKQEGQSLGERLIHAFGTAFGKGAQHVVIIGSDSPTLPRIYLEQAFQALEEADVVLGPALDGGYYLIGLSRPCLKLFENVSWSTDQVFEMTAKNAQAQGYALRVLPSHYDIDTIDDLLALHNELTQNAAPAPLTGRFLQALAKAKSLFSAS